MGDRVVGRRSSVLWTSLATAVVLCGLSTWLLILGGEAMMFVAGIAAMVLGVVMTIYYLYLAIILPTILIEYVGGKLIFYPRKNKKIVLEPSEIRFVSQKNISFNNIRHKSGKIKVEYADGEFYINWLGNVEEARRNIELLMHTDNYVYNQSDENANNKTACNMGNSTIKRSSSDISESYISRRESVSPNDDLASEDIFRDNASKSFYNKNASEINYKEIDFDEADIEMWKKSNSCADVDKKARSAEERESNNYGYYQETDIIKSSNAKNNKKDKNAQPSSGIDYNDIFGNNYDTGEDNKDKE